MPFFINKMLFEGQSSSLFYERKSLSQSKAKESLAQTTQSSPSDLDGLFQLNYTTENKTFVFLINEMNA
jgi:hypothetical protein